MFVYDFTSVKNGWRIGMMGSRLFGIYFNCNSAAFLSCVTILMAVYAMSHRYKYKILYTINIVIQISYVLLSQCRAAIIILVLIISSLVTYYIIRGREYKRVKCWLIFVCVAIGIVGGSILIEEGFTWIQKLRGSYVPHQSRFQLEKIIEVVKLVLSGNEENLVQAKQMLNKISSGRIDLLETSIEVWKKYPILGVGVNNFKPIGMDITTGTTIKGSQVVHTHYVFVEALVTTGIVGFVVWMKFVIQSIRVIIHLLKKQFVTKRIYT